MVCFQYLFLHFTWLNKLQDGILAEAEAISMPWNHHENICNIVVINTAANCEISYSIYMKIYSYYL